MSRFENLDGSWLTLGAVAALAAVGAVARRGSANEGEDEWPEPDEETLANEAVIHQPAWGKTTLFVEGKLVGEYANTEDAMDALRKWTEKNQLWPAIYQVNERGNTDLVDFDGNILVSWV